MFQTNKEDATEQSRNFIQRAPALPYVKMGVGSTAMSLGIAAIKEKKTWQNFVGLWVPAFFLFGFYSKLSRLQEEGKARPH